VEEESVYKVDITPEAEIYYLQFLEYLYKTHSRESAERKADELLDMAMNLDKNPYRGRIEDILAFLNKELGLSYTTLLPVKLSRSYILLMSR